MFSALSHENRQGCATPKSSTDVVRGSATDVILQELIRVGLAEWRDELYYITPAGKKIASVGEVVAEVGAHSSGNGGVGVG